MYLRSVFSFKIQFWGEQSLTLSLLEELSRIFAMTVARLSIQERR